MGAIGDVFAKTRQEGRIALIGYLPAGYPSPEEFPTVADLAFEAGLDILEIGFPIDDPFLDGKVIRDAMGYLRKAGLDSGMALHLAAPAAAKGRPLAAMMYAKTWDELGGQSAARALAAAGFAGILVVGVQEKNRLAIARASREAGLEPIGFATDMSRETLAFLAGDAAGFIYLPSHGGKTGDRRSFGSELGSRIATVKEAVEGLPVAVGFGVNMPKDIDDLRRLGADGAIVGTALVEAAKDSERMKRYVASLRAAASGRKT